MGLAMGDPVAKFANFDYAIDGLDEFGFPPLLRDGHYKPYWYDPLTWKMEHKFPFGFTLFGLGSHYVGNRALKRSLLHAIVPNFFIIGSIAAVSYGVCIYAKRLAIRENAIMDHYVKLHPDDFSHLVNSKQKRKFKDVLLPWCPSRGLNTIKGPRPKMDEDGSKD